MRKIRLVTLCKDCRFYDSDICQCKRYQRVKALFQPTDFCSWGLAGMSIKSLLEFISGNKRNQEILDKVRREEMENKKQEYVEYIEEHIKNINRAYREHGERLISLLNVDKSVLEELVKNHDKSKYDDLEFEYYRQYFYPTSDEIKNEEKFKYGFLMHQNKNPHHPEYWVYRDDNEVYPLVMPNQYIAEMILDWMSMSYKLGGDPYKYYKASGHKKNLHEDTRAIVENILIELFN